MPAFDAVDGSSTGHVSAMDMGATKAPMIRRSYLCKQLRQLVSTSQNRFTGITAHIDEVNAKSVLFNGTTTHPSRAEWSVRGAMDLTTGSVGATVTWFNPKTDTLLMRMNYELICKPL